MHKEFETNRVCAIDYYPYFLEALKETYTIVKKYNLPFRVQGKGSKDVQKFFYHYCLDKFCTGYKHCKSKFPKAYVIYPLPKDVFFTDKNLDQILKVLPVPWVKCSSFDSPDVEMAVLRAINKNNLISSKLNKFANKHALHVLARKNKNSKYFSLGAVDFSETTNK
jgi:hypothetical protein